MSEKIGGAKGTELDDEFVEMERVSHTSNAVNLLSDKLIKTEALFNEYMHIYLRIPVQILIIHVSSSYIFVQSNFLVFMKWLSFFFDRK